METKVTENVKQSYEQINDFAQNPLGEVRVIDKIEVNQWVRQGDVYLVRLDDNVDLSEYSHTQNRQIALGNTEGARHMVYDTVEVFKNKSKEYGEVKQNGIGFQSFGPILRSATQFSVCHPEHADISLPSGTYQVLYQVDMKTMQRVLD